MVRKVSRHSIVVKAAWERAATINKAYKDYNVAIKTAQEHSLPLRKPINDTFYVVLAKHLNRDCSEMVKARKAWEQGIRDIEQAEASDITKAASRLDAVINDAYRKEEADIEVVTPEQKQEYIDKYLKDNP